MYCQIYILSYLAIFLVSSVSAATDNAREANACTNSRKNILVSLGHSFARTGEKISRKYGVRALGYHARYTV